MVDPISWIIAIFKLSFGIFLFPFIVLYDLIRFLLWGKKKVKVIAAATSKELKCSKGCPPIPADGVWQCPGCGAQHSGWVWSECPACKKMPLYYPCPHCGNAIVNPKA